MYKDCSAKQWEWSFGTTNVALIMVQIIDKFRSLEHHQRNGINVPTKDKGISFTVSGCFGGRNRGTFAPLIVKSVDKHIYVSMFR
jgi:hypothetical protein